MAKQEGHRYDPETQQLTARMLVIERGEQELREMVRELTRSVSRLDETSQQRMDDFAAEVRESLSDLSQKISDTRLSDMARADERGFRIWGPAIAVAGLLLTIFGMVAAAGGFYSSYRFDTAEARINELQVRAELNTVAVTQIGRLQDELKSTREQLNFDRDYNHRLAVLAQGQKDPGPRYFPGTYVGPYDLPSVGDEPKNP